jgi:hypothetical protein
MDITDVPLVVIRYARSFGLQLDQVRWCESCYVCAPAVDGYQRRKLDELGFRDVCPGCQS